MHWLFGHAELGKPFLPLVFAAIAKSPLLIIFHWFWTIPHSSSHILVSEHQNLSSTTNHKGFVVIFLQIINIILQI